MVFYYVIFLFNGVLVVYISVWLAQFPVYAFVRKIK